MCCSSSCCCRIFSLFVSKYQHSSLASYIGRFEAPSTAKTFSTEPHVRLISVGLIFETAHMLRNLLAVLEPSGFQSNFAPSNVGKVFSTIVMRSSTKGLSFWSTFIFLHLVQPSLQNTHYADENALFVVQSVEPCHLYGDADLYGLGVRLSFYLTWATLFFAGLVEVRRRDQKRPKSLQYRRHSRSD